MENAVEALKMVCAYLAFGMALTVSIISFNNVKKVSDSVLYTKDETNYYDYQGATGKAAENRIVGLETIIPTLYKYYKENYTIVFKQGYYDYTTGDITNWEYLYIYETPSNKVLWTSSYNDLMNKKYNLTNVNSKIFSFDLEEETSRREPWTGSYDKAKQNLDMLLNGGTYYNPNNNAKYIDYSNSSQIGLGGFIQKYKDKKFVETISEYIYSSTQTEDSSITTLTKDKKKRMITFTYITNQ